MNGPTLLEEIFSGLVVSNSYNAPAVTDSFPALSTTLNINGNAEVSAASWDIYLDNVVLNSSSATTTAPTITDSKTATFSTTLTKPGDFYEFTIDVVNDGSIDAMIDGIVNDVNSRTNHLTNLYGFMINDDFEAMSVDLAGDDVVQAVTDYKNGLFDNFLNFTNNSVDGNDEMNILYSIIFSYRYITNVNCILVDLIVRTLKNAI